MGMLLSIEQTSGRQPSHSPPDPWTQRYQGQWAKLGTKQNSAGLEPVIGISNRLITQDINRGLAEKHQEEWCKATAFKQAKTLMGEYRNPKRTADLHSLNRTEVKTLTEVFIGHGNLAYHRHKIGLAESPLCRLCGEYNETSTHILCDCPEIRDKCQILMGCFSINVAVIQTKCVAQVLAIWHEVWGCTWGFSLWRNRNTQASGALSGPSHGQIINNI